MRQSSRDIAIYCGNTLENILNTIEILEKEYDYKIEPNAIECLNETTHKICIDINAGYFIDTITALSLNYEILTLHQLA